MKMLKNIIEKQTIQKKLNFYFLYKNHSFNFLSDEISDVQTLFCLVFLNISVCFRKFHGLCHVSIK